MITQSFPPPASFTEHTLPNLTGKVYIVTGSSAGVGKELARLLYSRNATVYIAARSAERAHAAISWIQNSHPSSTGTLHFLPLDLADLESIKTSAQSFLARETRLDVLFNNAGVMVPPQGSLTKQGLELQLGTNCVAPFLFTKLLTPMLIETAAKSEAGSVRVVWVSSGAAQLLAPVGGVDMENLGYEREKGVNYKYAVSKGGNVLHALEYQRRYRDSGIVSIVSPTTTTHSSHHPTPSHSIPFLTRTQALNPGNLKSDLQRHITRLQSLMINWMLYPAVNGAYTELFAGLAPEAASLKEGEWVVPFGRVMSLRKDFAGGKTAGEFWEWSERQVERYA